jgi:site-specific recombinase XerD
LSEHFNHEWVEYSKLTQRENNLQQQIRMLNEFSQYGEIRTLKRIKRVYLIPHFQELLQTYSDFCCKKGLKQITIRVKLHTLNRLCEYWENTGISQTIKLKAEDFYSYLEQNINYSVTTKQLQLYIIRDFIRFMAENHLCDEKLTRLFPVITVNGKNAYPSYFKKEDIIKILQSVDTGEKSGKCDYLAFLLAAQLGLRTRDIIELKLHDFDFQNSRLSFVSSKTGKLQEFPLSQELIYAAADYIKNSRRDCDFDNLFITNTGIIMPFRSGNFYYSLSKHISKAGVTLAKGQKRGLHALRASLATNMLGNGTALPTISNILGHTSLRTSKHYIKIDVEGLRRLALEVPV